MGEARRRRLIARSGVHLDVTGLRAVVHLGEAENAFKLQSLFVAKMYEIAEQIC
jgi:hypothetical protein